MHKHPNSINKKKQKDLSYCQWTSESEIFMLSWAKARPFPGVLDEN